MNDNEVKTVQMTAEEAAQYAAFKAEQERKAAADKARKDRKVYGQMVDEEIEQALPMISVCTPFFTASIGSPYIEPLVSRSRYTGSLRILYYL